jgi:hypothetical protein
MLSRRRLLAGTAAGAGLWIACTVRRTATVREAARIVDAAPGRDGAGVKLRRALGGCALPMVDPFLLLDEIRSSDPADYANGFPEHPHRGFETVSYVLRGGFAHADSVGNHGLIADGGAQCSHSAAQAPRWPPATASSTARCRSRPRPPSCGACSCGSTCPPRAS